MKNNTLIHLGLAILRIVPSAFMLTHGYPKLMNLINGNTEFANPFGIGQAPSLFLAVIGEFICPLLMIIGFKTRWAAIPTAITMFVAGFMGSPSMNFIHAKVVEHENKLAIAVESKGKEQYLPVPSGNDGLKQKVGQEVVLGIRPEQITHELPHLVDAEQTVTFPCHVEVTEPTGADTLVLVKLNDQEVNCRVHPAEAGKPGEDMQMMFNMEKAVFFDLQTEDRI